MKRIVVIATAVALALTGLACNGGSADTTDAPPPTGDVVQERKTDRTLGIAFRKICVGPADESCEWIDLGTGNDSLSIYQKCDVGDPYPDCKNDPLRF